jgi:hypothetical protein
MKAVTATVTAIFLSVYAHFCQLDAHELVGCMEGSC